MVPFELLFRLHAHLRGPEDASCPTHLHLPYELTLDALTAPNQQTTAPPVSPPPLSQHAALNPTELTTTPSAIPASVLQAAITEDMPTPPPAPHTSPKLRIAPVEMDATLVPLPPSPEIQRGTTTIPALSEDADPPPENLLVGPSTLAPSPRRVGDDSPSYFTQSLSSTLCDEIREATSSTIDLPSAPQRPAPAAEGVGSGGTVVNGTRLTHNNGAKSPRADGDEFRNFLMTKSFLVPTAPVASQQAPRLGNLMLSSCPGKKGLSPLVVI